MKNFFQKNVSLFLFFLTLFSDNILLSNFLFSLSVKSEIGKTLSDTLADDRSDALQFKKQVKGSDFTRQTIGTNGNKSIGNRGRSYHTLALLIILLLITVLFTIFFVISVLPQRLVFFLGSFVFSSMVFYFILTFIKFNKNKIAQFVVPIILLFLSGTGNYLFFTLGFTDYIFLFIFSTINYGIVACIVIYLLACLIWWLGKKLKNRRHPLRMNPNPLNETPIRAHNDWGYRGLESKLFNGKVFLTVSFLLGFLGSALVLLEQFFFPAISLFAFVSYGFFGLSALLLILFVRTISYESLKGRSLQPDFEEGRNFFSFLSMFFVGVALMSYGASTIVLLFMFVSVGTLFLLLLVRIVQLARKYRKITAENTSSLGVSKYSPTVLSNRITLSWSIGLCFLLIGLIFLGLSFVFSVVLQVPVVLILSIFYTVFVFQIFFVYFFLGKKQGASSGGVFSRILTWLKKTKAKFKRGSIDENPLFVESFSEYFLSEQLQSINDSLGMNFSKELRDIEDKLVRRYEMAIYAQGDGVTRSTPLEMLCLLVSDTDFYYDLSLIFRSLWQIFEAPKELELLKKWLDSKTFNALRAFYVFCQNFHFFDSNNHIKMFEENHLVQFYKDNLESQIADTDLPIAFLNHMESDEPNALKQMNENFVALKKTLDST